MLSGHKHAEVASVSRWRVATSQTLVDVFVVSVSEGGEQEEEDKKRRPRKNSDRGERGWDPSGRTAAA